MANTTNFNWATPDDTDLVKDGAAAIRTLGSSIDTSFVDLKGGTTGQVLSKATNTDLDYTWITPNVGDITEVQAGVGISVTSGTGPIPTITNSSTDLITTAGDLLYGTAADTVARLGIGTAGQVLKVNSGATAPEWGAASSGLTFISSATFTTAASQSVNDVFTSTYTNYRIIFAVNAPTNDGNANFVLRASGTDFSGTQTIWSYAGYEDAGNLVKAGANTTGAFWTLFQLDGGTTADRYFCSMDISRPKEAKETTATWLAQYVNSSNTWYANNQGGGLQYTTNQYDGFSLKASAGTISGKIWVYGYSN